MTEPRVGVFLCDCGDRIASILDLNAVLKAASGLAGVASARRLRYSCSPKGLSAMRSVVRREGLDRVVVAGCTPRTLGPRFRALCEEMGIDAGHFELVDIREGCAWVHRSQPEAATAKAVDLLRMGVAKVRLSHKRTYAACEVAGSVLVIGGGLAGMTAALTVADADLPVTLVEREPVLGGMLRQVNTLFPDHRSAVQLIANKVDATTHHPCIKVLTRREVTSVSRSVGRYGVTVGTVAGGERESLSFTVGAIIVATGARVMSLREMAGRDDENGGGRLGHDAPDGFEAVHDRHGHIHGDEIGTEHLGFLHRLFSVGRLADDGDAVGLLQDLLEEFADHHGVVHDEDSDFPVEFRHALFLRGGQSTGRGSTPAALSMMSCIWS